MVNILPTSARKELHYRYYANLAAAFFAFLALVVAIGGALLAPSYLLSQEEAISSERFKTALLETLALKGDTGAARELAMLAEEADLLAAYADSAVASSVIAPILQALPDNVGLTKLSFSSGIEKNGSVTLSGVAGSRASLVEFVNALQARTLFSGVAVPVSDLAKDTDISFTLSFDFDIP